MAWFASRGQRAKLAIAVVFLALLGTLCFYRPLLREFREWRAERLVEEATAHAERGQWEETRRTATASLQLRESLTAIRLLLRAYEHLQDRDLLKLAVALFQHPAAIPDDRVRALRICIDLNDQISAAALIRTVPENERNSTPFRYQLTRFLLATRQFKEAARIVDADPPGRPGPELQLLLAEGFARSRERDARIAVASRLEQVLAGDHHESTLQAIRFMATLPDDWIHKDLASQVVARFEGDQSLAPADRLRVELFRLALDPTEREATIDELCADYQAHHLKELLAWLERLGERQRIVDLTRDRVTGPDALAIFQQRVRALASLDKLDQLQSELENPVTAVKDVPLACARATLAFRRREPAKALQSWKNAMEIAARTPTRNWFYFIADSAKLAGNRDVEMEALARGIEARLGKPPQVSTLAPLFAWLHEHDETTRLLRITGRLLEREPGNPVLLNNYHYLKALRGVASENDLEVLRALVSAFPTDSSFHGSLAFALVKAGQPAQALQVLDSEHLPEKPHNEAPVRTAALTALNRETEASRWRTQIDWSRFSPREITVMKNLLASPPEAP